MSTRDVIDIIVRHQVSRFLLLGGFAAAVNWMARIALSAVLPMAWAILIAYAIGMSVGFYLYRSFVFRDSSRLKSQQIMIFLTVNLVGAVIVLFLTYCFLALQPSGQYAQQIREAIAHGLAIALGAVANFFGHKLLTFRSDRTPKSPPEYIAR